MFTSTGKKQSTAAITIFESGLSSPNQLFVIGAKAMIGIALAAIMYGISAVAEPPPAREHEREQDRRAPIRSRSRRAPP